MRGRREIHQIITEFERPDESLVALIADMHVGVVGHLVGPRQTCSNAIKPLRDDWRICGPALTVRPQFWDDRLTCELAPKYAQPGDILVIDAGGNVDSAIWGLSMHRAAIRSGAAGVVIDGACMNKALISAENHQVPLFSRGVSPTTRNSEHAGSINVPVICGGVIVNPGDIILGDADGIVVVPPAMVEQVVAECTAHDTQARSDAREDIPFYERKDSEAKMRALTGVDWH